MTGSAGTPGSGFRRSTALLVAAALFMENLDATIVSTAAPAIARDIGTDVASVGIAITAYLMAVAAVVPLSGWLSERLGTRPVLLTAITVFTGASALCAASSTVAELIVFRALQGVGGAMMVPVGQLSVYRSAGKAEMFRAVALLTWPGLVAPVVAPALGGLLATYASWRWIFLVNLPIGAALLWLGWRLLERPTGHVYRPLDVRGALATGAGLAGLVWAAALLTTTRPPWAACAALAAAAGLVLALAVRHMTRVDSPLVDLRVLRFPTMRLAFVGGGVFRLAVTAVPFLLPLMFQEAFGWSAVKAGAIVLWLFVGNLAAKAVTSPVIRRWGFRPVLRASTGVLVATIGALAFVRPDPLWALIALAVVSGAARSVGFTCLNTVGYADVPVADLTAANTVAATLGQLAAGLGVAVGAVGIRVGALALPTSGAAGPYRFAMLLVAAAALVPVASTWRAHRDVGHQVMPVSR